MPFIGEISAIGAATLWSSSSFIFTEASVRIGSIQLNVSRMFLALIFLTITILALNLGFAITCGSFTF